MDYICTACDYIGPKTLVKPGSRLVEILLWTVLLIPGPFYSIWRVMGKHYACPKCGEKIMVPAALGHGIVQDKDISKKEHVVDMEIKLAQMEKELQEEKLSKNLEEAPIKLATEEGTKAPAPKRQTKEGANEW